jgi:hypothetical protein
MLRVLYISNNVNTSDVQMGLYVDTYERDVGERASE